MNAAGPSHRRGKVVDDAILSAVIEVIGSAGTLSIKVEDVAEIAGVNKTTIYRRFPTREALVLAAVLEHADTTVPIPDLGTLRADLFAIAKLVRETSTSPLGRALLAASEHRSPELAKLRPAFWNARFGAAAVVLSRAERRGECAPVNDPHVLIELMTAPIHFRASQTGGALTDEFLEVQVDRLIQQLEPSDGVL